MMFVQLSSGNYVDLEKVFKITVELEFNDMKTYHAIFHSYAPGVSAQLSEDEFKYIKDETYGPEFEKREDAEKWLDDLMKKIEQIRTGTRWDLKDTHY